MNNVIAFPGKVIPFEPGNLVRIVNGKRQRAGCIGPVQYTVPEVGYVGVGHGADTVNYHATELVLIRGRDE